MSALVFHGQSCTVSSLNSRKMETKTEISMEAALILSVIHAVTQQVFIQHLPCARHCSVYQG